MPYAYTVDPLAVWTHNPTHARMHERSHELSHPRILRLPWAFAARRGWRSAHLSRTPCLRHVGTPCLRHVDVGHDEQQSSDGRVSVEGLWRSQCLPRPQLQRACRSCFSGLRWKRAQARVMPSLQHLEPPSGHFLHLRGAAVSHHRVMSMKSRSQRTYDGG